jgi:hypothetical protein
MLPTMALRADKVGPSADRRGALAAETTRRAAGPVGRSRQIDPSTWNRTAGTTSVGVAGFACCDVGGTIWTKTFAQYVEAQIGAEIRRSLFPTL